MRTTMESNPSGETAREGLMAAAFAAALAFRLRDEGALVSALRELVRAVDEEQRAADLEDGANDNESEE